MIKAGDIVGLHIHDLLYGVGVVLSVGSERARVMWINENDKWLGDTPTHAQRQLGLLFQEGKDGEF